MAFMNSMLICVLLCITAFAAGAINSVAGGGTLLTFPALLSVLTSVAANTTSTVALVPGSMAAAWGYRRELTETGPWLALLLPPSLLGGLVGSLLLILLPPGYFEVVIPWLLLLAAALFMVQPALNRYLQKGAPASIFPPEPVIGASEDVPEPANTPSTVRPDVLPTSPWIRLVVVAFQFVVGIYGGYFGAGIGILTLSALSVMGLTDIHRMNAVKTVLAASINLVSVGVFVFSGTVAWRFAPVMAVASIAGGYAGARVSRRLPQGVVRWLVIAIGFALASYYFVG
jgi:uncharacterized membrane protein YfcA